MPDEPPVDQIAIRPYADHVGAFLAHFASRIRPTGTASPREHGFRRVVLDAFAANLGAIEFQDRCRYRPDHIRLAKPLR